MTLPTALTINLVSYQTGKKMRRQKNRLQFVMIDLQVLTKRLNRLKPRKLSHLLNMMMNMTKKKRRSKKKLLQ